MTGRVRLATVEDAAALATIYAPYVTETAISFEETPPSPEAFERRIGDLMRIYPFLVFVQEGSVLGYAYASRHKERSAYRWSVDVTVYVMADAHRRGVGRALYADLFGYLERQGFHAAFAGVTLPNEKSVGFHRALGFEPVGTFREVGFKLGAWRDVAWFGRRLSGGGLPAEPIPLPRLLQAGRA